MKFYALWWIGLGLFFLSHHPLCAQAPADTVQLPEILISASRFELPAFQQSMAISYVSIKDMEVYGLQTLEQSLAAFTPVFVRHQGAGLLASISQLGFSPNQTKVLWNGMELNHPMVGQVDFSTFPSSILSGFAVSDGTGSADVGGNAIGGTVTMISNASLRSSATVQWGSFQSYDADIKHGFRLGSSIVQLSMYSSFQENDFPFQNRLTTQREIRTDNWVNSAGALASMQHSTSSWNASTSLWISWLERGIPGPVSSSRPASEQSDASIRFTQQWKHRETSSAIDVWARYDKLDYQDPIFLLTGAPAVSASDSYFTGTRAQIPLFLSEVSEHRLIFEGSLLTVSSSNFEDLKHRSQVSVSNASKLEWNRFTLLPTLRLDYFSDFGAALSPAVGINRVLSEHLSVFGNVSYNFNPPTFNGLYWPGVGNSSLRPERSLKLQSGIHLKKNWEFTYLKGSLTGTFATLQDGILWQPGLDGQWRPINILEQERRVFSSDITYGLKKNDIGFQVQSIVSITKATISRARFVGDQEVGNQLRYVPFVQYKVPTKLSLKQWHLSFIPQWISKRFTDESEQLFLPSYLLFDGSLAYSTTVGATSIQFQSTISNLLSEHIEIIAFYPLPPAQLTFSLIFTF